jgi:hypothetical protein
MGELGQSWGYDQLSTEYQNKHNKASYFNTVDKGTNDKA